ncbi:TolC family protein [Acidovorax sp. IB03]|uniref:TolC family protein n=1 Tax=Acidovorax sp. IB03 TaxID=2779366 RepID=UPI0018E6DD88|nr:TolC family protein [Acidovorax sp. IB03]MBJ2163757.1 TolC family protein [Acidovorax sp. IB03]
MKQWIAIAGSAALMTLSAPAGAWVNGSVPELLATPLVRQALDQDPAVLEARRTLAASGHGAAALRAGAHEWTTRATVQSRRYGAGGRSNEWEAGLERAFRIGGKAKLDGDIGDVEIGIAKAQVGEALHESARTLADLWMDVVASRRLKEVITEQRGFAQDSLKAVESRRKAGDASVLEVNLATTDLIEVDRQLNAATTAEAKAQAKLRARFPLITELPQPIADPLPLETPQAQWLERILAESDPIRVAEGLAKKAALTADRLRADRTPDPTVGVFVASEARRSERIYGVSVSIPLAGTYRNERMLQALQEAEAARTRLDGKRREVEMEVTETYIDAMGSYERWRLTSQGLTATQNSARLTQRAYSLGEVDLQGLLLARKQALDATIAAEQARVEALRAQSRLMIDAHLVWDLEED